MREKKKIATYPFQVGGRREANAEEDLEGERGRRMRVVEERSDENPGH